MTNTVEYISTALILIMMFTATIGALIWITNPVISTETKQNLQSTAERLVVDMLEYSGSPPQWGNDITLPSSGISSMGLALASSNDAAYILDSDKITRLTDNSSGTYVSADTVRHLLNLNDYDFNVKFTPALNLTAKATARISNGNATYETAFDITVTTHDMIKVANVNLTVYMVIAQISGSNVNYTNIGVRTTTTDSDGLTHLDYTSAISSLAAKHTFAGSILMIYANYYGLKAMTTHPSSSKTLMATIIGSDVILSVTPDSMAQPQVMVEGTYSSIFNATFSDVTANVHGMAPWITGRVYRVSYLAFDAYFLALVVKYQGTYQLVIANRAPTGMIGDSVPAGAEVVNLRKLVVINEVYYYADLRVWRTSTIEG